MWKPIDAAPPGRAHSCVGRDGALQPRQVLAHLQQRVRHGHHHRVVAVERTAEPDFGFGHGSNIEAWNTNRSSRRSSKQPPDGDDWLHEIKYDGYRMGCAISPDGVRLTSRNGLDYTAALPEIVADAKALPVTSALLDGEVVVLMEDGARQLSGAAAGDGRGAG